MHVLPICTIVAVAAVTLALPSPQQPRGSTIELLSPVQGVTDARADAHSKLSDEALQQLLSQLKANGQLRAVRAPPETGLPEVSATA